MKIKTIISIFFSLILVIASPANYSIASSSNISLQENGISVPSVSRVIGTVNYATGQPVVGLQVNVYRGVDFYSTLTLVDGTFDILFPSTTAGIYLSIPGYDLNNAIVLMNYIGGCCILNITL